MSDQYRKFLIFSRMLKEMGSRVNVMGSEGGINFECNTRKDEQKRGTCEYIRN